MVIPACSCSTRRRLLTCRTCDRSFCLSVFLGICLLQLFDTVGQVTNELGLDCNVTDHVVQRLLAVVHVVCNLQNFFDGVPTDVATGTTNN